MLAPSLSRILSYFILMLTCYIYHLGWKLARQHQLLQAAKIQKLCGIEQIVSDRLALSPHVPYKEHCWDGGEVSCLISRWSLRPAGHLPFVQLFIIVGTDHINPPEYLCVGCLFGGDFIFPQYVPNTLSSLLCFPLLSPNAVCNLPHKSYCLYLLPRLFLSW